MTENRSRVADGHFSYNRRARLPASSALLQMGNNNHTRCDVNKCTGICIIVALCWTLSTTSLAQNKKVPEECVNNADCETGNCVKLKEESKNVCLYCPQGDYEQYWSDVQNKCKNLDEIGRYSDLKSELQKSANRREEFSLPWLYNRRDLNADCLKARSTRENSCWKDQIDSGHKQQLDDLKEALNATEGLINDSIRNGKAYKVDREHFDHLMEDEEHNCKDLHKDFEWLSSLKEDEQADCTEISSVADRAHDCREVRKSIVEAFQDHASSERTDALKEAEAAESEAKRILELKNSKHLCK